MAEKKRLVRFTPMTRAEAAIGSAALIGFFVLWYLWAAVGEKVLGWIECHPGLAAWIQAIGAIAAMAVAIWVSKAPAIEERRQIIVSLRMLYVGLVEGSINIRRGLGNGDGAMIILARVCLEELMASAKAVRPELLPLPVLFEFRKMHLYCAQLIFCAKKFEENIKSENSAADFNTLVKTVLDNLRSASDLVFGEIDGGDGVADFDFDKLVRNIELRIDKMSESVK